MKKVKGFTLLEILIVVVIIGILASLAIPRYIKSTEVSNASEAYNNLNAIRKAEWVYYAERQDWIVAKDFNMLCIEDPNSMPQPPRKFTYTISVNAGNVSNPFNLTASRQGGLYNGNYINMNANGDLDETHWLR